LRDTLLTRKYRRRSDDNDFKWHPAYEYDYGLPITEPVRTEDTGAGVVSYTRTYSRCQISVTCDKVKCVERGEYLIHNCCNATVKNTSTGLLVDT
jgi:hypothetical protein